MSGEAPDIREQGDCPGAELCDASCDQHIPTPCPVCGGAGVVDTSPPAVDRAPWLQTDTDCAACGGSGETDTDNDTEES